MSLAIWIGGVSYELWQFANRKGRWGTLSGFGGALLDVLAGTSAGGLNAAFLAAASLDPTNADLSGMRNIWLDVAGLESYVDGGDELLRDPGDKNVDSILDGELFFRKLQESILALLPMTHDDAETPKLDLLLTATSLWGTTDNSTDDLGGRFAGLKHDAAFHFQHGVANRHDFAYSNEAARVGLANALALGARATASFPGAFAPVSKDIAGLRAGSDSSNAYQSLVTEAARDHSERDSPWPVFDGGVLVDLPIRQAVESISSMPAVGHVRRVLAAVVPDPSDPRDSTGVHGLPHPSKVVSAALVTIPRNQSVAQTVRDIRRNNADVHARRAARWELMNLSQPILDNVAIGLHMAYAAHSRSQIAATIGRGTDWTPNQVLHALPPDLPWIPIDRNLDDPYSPPGGSCWGASAVRRMTAVTLDIVSRARDLGASYQDCNTCQDQVHDIRQNVDAMFPAGDHASIVLPRSTHVGNAVITLAAHLSTQVLAWPTGNSATALDGRNHLNESVGELCSALSRFIAAWPSGPVVPGRPGKPAVFCAAFDAKRFLIDMEVIQTSFGGFADSSEQVVELGILSPRLISALDPKQRATSTEKLAGDDLGHFGAFLKRSWRANDWMWGRLDAVTFLAAVLNADGRGNVSYNSPGVLFPSRQREIAASIVREEAPFICEAVIRDARKGARNVEGSKLFGGESPKTSIITWDEAKAACGITDTDDVDAAASFLGHLSIGKETIRSEFPTSLVVRLTTRTVATTAAILDKAGLPVVQRFVSAIAKPVRGLSVAAYRFTKTSRPTPAGYSRSMYLVAMSLIVIPAALGFLDVLKIFDTGALAPIAWIWLAAALLASALIAPLTSVLLTTVMVGAGLLSSLPSSPPNWLPGSWKAPDKNHWRWTWLPLDRWWALLVIAICALILPTWPVGWVDERWRRSRIRASLMLDAWKAIYNQKHQSAWTTYVALLVVAGSPWLQDLWKTHPTLVPGVIAPSLILGLGVMAAQTFDRHRDVVVAQLATPAPMTLRADQVARAVLGIAIAILCVVSVVIKDGCWHVAALVGATALAVVLVAWEVVRSAQTAPTPPDRATLWAIAPAASVWLVLSAFGKIDLRAVSSAPDLFLKDSGGNLLHHLVFDALEPGVLFFGLMFAYAIASRTHQFGFIAISLGFAVWEGSWRAAGHSTDAITIVAGSIGWFALSHLVLVPLRLRSRTLAGPLLLLCAVSIVLAT